MKRSRGLRAQRQKGVRLSLLIFHRKLVGTGVFRIVVENPVMPFCFLDFWGLVKHIYISGSGVAAVPSGPEENA